MARRLALAGALLLAPGCRSEVACDQCMPCTTPPCYKDDDADMGLQYTSNLPLGSARSPSPCWSQRNTAARRQNNPSKDGWANEKCVCDDDYVEYQTYSVGLDSLGREIMYTRPWYHRFCGPKQTEEFKIMGELTPVGAAAMYVCGCQQRYHVRSTVDVYDPYVSSADNPMPASPMMALLSNVRPQERSGDGACTHPIQSVCPRGHLNTPLLSTRRSARARHRVLFGVARQWHS
tara:strand:- start:2163 stop:2864 length:702 start_codon:yes stop_codon:yes gene_type:complete